MVKLFQTDEEKDDFFAKLFLFGISVYEAEKYVEWLSEPF